MLLIDGDICILRIYWSIPSDLGCSNLSSLAQVAEEIWICENEAVTKWQGDITTYKELLKKQVLKNNARAKDQKDKKVKKKTGVW